MEKKFLLVLSALILFILRIDPCWAQEKLDAQQLLVNMEKANAAIEDVSFKGVTTSPGLPRELITSYWFKRPCFLLSKLEGPRAAYISLLKQEGEKIYFYDYSASSNEISKKEVPQNEETCRGVPYLFEAYLTLVRRAVEEKAVYTLDKKEGPQGVYYVFKADLPGSSYVFYIREADWLIFKRETSSNRGNTVTELRDIKINSGKIILSGKNFSGQENKISIDTKDKNPSDIKNELIEAIQDKLLDDTIKEVEMRNQMKISKYLKNLKETYTKPLLKIIMGDKIEFDLRRKNILKKTILFLNSQTPLPVIKRLLTAKNPLELENMIDSRSI